MEKCSPPPEFIRPESELKGRKEKCFPARLKRDCTLRRTGAGNAPSPFFRWKRTPLLLSCLDFSFFDAKIKTNSWFYIATATEV